MKSISSTLGSIGLLVASAAMITGCSNNSGQQQMQMSAPEIATITLSPQKANLETTFPATIQGKTDIAIRPQVTGFIT